MYLLTETIVAGINYVLLSHLEIINYYFQVLHCRKHTPQCEFKEQPI